MLKYQHTVVAAVLIDCKDGVAWSYLPMPIRQAALFRASLTEITVRGENPPHINFLSGLTSFPFIICETIQ